MGLTSSAETPAYLEQRGAPFGSYDVIITEHARSDDLIAVIGNLQEFDTVDELPSKDRLPE